MNTDQMKEGQDLASGVTARNDSANGLRKRVYQVDVSLPIAGGEDVTMYLWRRSYDTVRHDFKWRRRPYGSHHVSRLMAAVISCGMECKRITVSLDSSPSTEIQFARRIPRKGE